jgi:hypothetical protein
MVPWPDADAVCHEVNMLISDPIQRQIFGQRAHEFYESNFSLKNTVNSLISNHHSA